MTTTTPESEMPKRFGINPTSYLEWLVDYYQAYIENIEIGISKTQRITIARPRKLRVSWKEADEIKSYINNRHLLEPRWHEITHLIGGLEFDIVDLERELTQKTAEVEALKKQVETWSIRCEAHRQNSVAAEKENTQIKQEIDRLKKGYNDPDRVCAD